MKIKLFTIPNLLTLSSLLCGSFAVVSALVYGDLALAFWLTIAAGVFDYSDGFVARLLKCPSAIGVQLDSLSDMVSFGFGYGRSKFISAKKVMKYIPVSYTHLTLPTILRV